MPESFPLLIAHRGASSDAPENTLPAIRAAWNQSADGCEIDVQLTRDGVLVAFHDFDTQRLTGRPGTIAERTLCEVRELDAAFAWNTSLSADDGPVGLGSSQRGGTEGDERDAAGQGIRRPIGPVGIPTLAEVLAEIPAGKRLYIELKCGAECVPALSRDLLTCHAATDTTTIICFDAGVLQAVRKALPSYPVLWIAEFPPQSSATDTAGGSDDFGGGDDLPISQNALASQSHRRHDVTSPAPVEATSAFHDADIVRRWIDVVQTLGFQGIDLGRDVRLNADVVAAMHAAGLIVGVWTVNEAAEADRLAEAGVDFITTDSPGRLAVRR